MLSFLLTLKRLMTGLWRALKLKNFQALLVLVVITLTSGTILCQEEGLSVIDAIYFCVATLSTIGHPTFVPQTTLGKTFTIVYIIVGTGLFLGMIGYIAYFLIKQTDKESD